MTFKITFKHNWFELFYMFLFIPIMILFSSYVSLIVTSKLPKRVIEFY